MAQYDDDNLIPVFGFGDSTTTDKSVFPFFPDRPARGFAEVLERYKELVPRVHMSGPTNFAPAIEAAIQICERTSSYHILIIIADGQVTNRMHTEAAIVRASAYPLSIILVGVGDGPWDMMEDFDDSLPQRRFDVSPAETNPKAARKLDTIRCASPNEWPQCRRLKRGGLRGQGQPSSSFPETAKAWGIWRCFPPNSGKAGHRPLPPCRLQEWR